VQAPHAPKPETTDALIAQLVAASAWQARAGAALSLAHHPGEDVVTALVRALRDPSVEVAVAAVDALVSHADESATQALLCVLKNHDGYFSPITRVAAISALSQRLDVAHYAPLFSAVRDIDAEVSIAAAAVITERMPHAESAQLLSVLRDTSGFYLPIVRLAVADALERAGILHAGVAEELLPSERDACVRRVLERASHLTAEASE
jgi:HEAT repeat protein